MLRRCVILGCCAVQLLSLSPAAAALDVTVRTATVVWVFDGDTFAIVMPGHPETDEANLMAVDAAGWGEEGGSCYALEAAKFLQSLILNKEVTVTWDSQDKTDHRGRLLLYLEVEGKDINAEVIRGGYGWVPRKFPADRKEQYLRFEHAARESKAGLWGVCPERYLEHLK